MTETLIDEGRRRQYQQVEEEVEVLHQSFVIFEMDRRHVTKEWDEVEVEVLRHYAILLSHHATTLPSLLATLLSHRVTVPSHLAIPLFHLEDEEVSLHEEEVVGTIALIEDENRLLITENPSDREVEAAHHLDLFVQITGKDLRYAKGSLCGMMSGDHHLHQSDET